MNQENKLPSSDASRSSINASGDITQSLRNIGQLLGQTGNPPRNVLIYGPPGVARTQIARTLGAETGRRFIVAGADDLLSPQFGQSTAKVGAVFQRARESAPSIVFIDEFETFFPPFGRADQPRKEIVMQLLQELNAQRGPNSTVCLLAAALRPGDIDPAILSRFTDRIEIPAIDAAAAG